jgi:hypothetical protein
MWFIADDLPVRTRARILVRPLAPGHAKDVYGNNIFTIRYRMLSGGISPVVFVINLIRSHGNILI